MNTNKMREIDRLVSELHDDGLEGDALRLLEELLIDDPFAQRHYWQLVNSHFALSVAVNSKRQKSNLSEKRSATTLPAAGAGAKDRFPLLATRSRWWLAAAAAVVLVGFGAALQFQGSGRSSIATAPGTSPRWPSRALEQMPTITQVSWEGPSFAVDSRDWQPATVASAGAITLRVKEGEVADGYLFCLLPGDSVKLVATFDATGENSLSVVEILGNERATLKKVSFHNSGTGPKPLHANPHVRNRRYGILGHWSETNTTEFPRYFLLTGVHKLARPKPNESWRLSKIAVLVESDVVVHLGWDDSGPAPAEGEAYHEDYDYDDLAASLFFDRRAGEAKLGRDEIRVVANQELSALQLPAAPEGGYVFELGPGSTAVVKAVSEARDLNAIVALDADTQEILWSSSKEVAQSSNLGAACLLNPSATAKRIRLVGIHRPHDSKGPGIPWRASTLETLYEQPGFLIIGFDDSLGDKDFNDVRASVLVTSAPESN